MPIGCGGYSPTAQASESDIDILCQHSNVRVTGGPLCAAGPLTYHSKPHLLVLKLEPGDHQVDPASWTPPRQVRGSQQWVDGRARHPRQAEEKQKAPVSDKSANARPQDTILFLVRASPSGCDDPDLAIG